MDTPRPIDVNRLKSMLGGAKAIMNKVESGDYQTGNVDGETLALGDSLVEGNGDGGGNAVRNAAPQMVSGQAHYPNLENSKMPEAIKKAMMESPIPQASMAGPTFTLNDLDYEKDEKQVPPPVTPKTNRTQMNESTNLVGITENQIRTIVKDEMINFFTNYFAKTLAEDTQKKLIQQLLKEGKLSVKKKK